VIIKNEVYDVTEFLSVCYTFDIFGNTILKVGQKHPGGPDILLQYGGRDATSAYEPIHTSDAIQRNLSPSQCLGPLRSSDARNLELQEKQRGQTKDEIRVERAMKQRPPLGRILSLADMEVI
jgi:L-lactate dehydrogenase (cytochrome)